MAKDVDLNFRLIGRDVSASKALRGVGTNAGKVSDRLGKLGGAFAGIGTAAVIAGGMVAIDFGKQSVDAFMDAQAQAAKFDDAFTRFPSLTAYKAQIDDLAQSLALKTKYDDDATKSAAATLAKFGLTGEQMKTLIPLTQDFASATGQDLGSAAGSVGKALLGNVKALKQLGISYKPTGDKAKDLANITQLLKDKVGGFAEKEGKTAAGTAAILSNQFGEVKETVGSYLVPALTKMGRWIIDVGIPAFSQMVAWLKDRLGPVFATVGQWITTKFVPAIQNIATIFMTNVWPAIQKVAGMIAENLAPAVTALSEYWTNSLLPGIQRAIPYFQKVAIVIGVVVAAVVVVVAWLLGKLIPALAAVMGKIAEWGSKAMEAVSNFIDNFGSIVEFVKGLPKKIALAAIGMWDGIKDSFRSAVNWIVDKWNDLQFVIGGGEFMGKTLPSVTLDTPNIPRLANGGIVSRPTLALIGEAGPEAVVPLSRGGGMGTHYHLHLDGVVVGSSRTVGRDLLALIKSADAVGTVRA